jgi:hypothetical protein
MTLDTGGQTLEQSFQALRTMAREVVGLPD